VSVAISMSVRRLSDCLSPVPAYTLLLAVTRSSSDDNTICYVLPVFIPEICCVEKMYNFLGHPVHAVRTRGQSLSS